MPNEPGSASTTDRSPSAPSAPSAPSSPEASLLQTLAEAQGRATPLVLIHGAIGNAQSFVDLAAAFRGRRPLYGIRAYGSCGEGPPDASVAAMADRYAELVRTALGDRPLVIGGYSLGGLVAVELARRLQAAGLAVPLVVLLDTNLELGFPVRSARLRRVGAHLRRSGPRALWPWLRRVIEWRLGRRPSEHDLRRLGFVDPERLGYRDLEAAGRAAGAAYVPVPYDGDVAVVQSASMWPMYPAAYGWSPYVKGRLEVLTTPGDHLTMLISPQSTAMAELLLSACTSAERRHAAPPAGSA